MRATVLLLLAVACQAKAQSPVTLMPEGSREGSVGLVYGEAWARRGSNARENFIYPWFSMQWSNGAFVEGLSAGWKLSDEPHFQYGPMVGFSNRAQGAGGTQLAPGGFVQWRVLHDVEVVAQAGVGARDGKVKAELAVNWINPLNADHTLMLQAATGEDDGWSNRLGALALEAGTPAGAGGLRHRHPPGWQQRPCARHRATQQRRLEYCTAVQLLEAVFQPG